MYCLGSYLFICDNLHNNVYWWNKNIKNKETMILMKQRKNETGRLYWAMATKKLEINWNNTAYRVNYKPFES